ncbi:MAG: protein kinase [Acidobacteria bacterium]|nr:protein kinase [Acidobacteriota bacterium]
MTPERWQQIEALYHAALELAPAARVAFLAEACASDAELRHEVESLLTANEQAASFIEKPPSDIAAGMMAEHSVRSLADRTFGHYRIISMLGAGGMGEVYRAQDLRLDRDVAVKILPAHLAQDAEALRRFEREAKAVAALSHPNILAIFDFGTESNVSYAVMELLEGETLRARLARAALPWRQAVEIAAAVADGLAAAHAKGIIHRDLKPENIFLTADGQIKILDFGIARVKHAVTTETETMTGTTRPGTILGTVGYMSPEQVKGEPAEAPSDLFALGCVLYEMVSGRRPFAGATVTETIAAILRDEPPALAGLQPAVPAKLEQLIKHCLEKKAAARFQAARDLSFDLRQLLSESGGLAVAAKPAKARGRTATLSVAAVALMLAAASLIYLFNRSGAALDSLAVLPLRNVSGDEEVEYLSEGITESLINSLSQLPQLKRVIARSTVASYKDKEVDPRVIGKDLQVRSLLIGKLTKRGDELIIGAELVNTADGSRLWGDSTRRKLADAMLIQAELAQQIAEKLRLRLSGAEQQRLAKRPTDNPEAYRLFVEGRHYSQLRTTDGTKQGIELLQQAVRLDSGYALAYAGLADGYYNSSSMYEPPAAAMPKVKAAAAQALQLDETLAEAHTALAQVKAFYDWEWPEAEKELKRALELNPGYARAAFVYGMILSEQGRMDEALGQFTRAHELDPLSLETSAWIAFAYYLNRKYDASIEESKKLVATDRNFYVAHLNLALAFEQTGRFAEAEAELKQWQSIDPASPYPKALLAHLYASSGKPAAAQKILGELLKADAPKNYVDPYFISLIYTGLGDKEQAFAWLERAYQARSEDLLNLKKEPRLDSLRADPRFTDLLRRLQLAP